MIHFVLLVLASLSQGNAASGESSLHCGTVAKDSLLASTHILNPEMMAAARLGFQRLKDAGVLDKTDYLTVIDMSESANRQRMYVIDPLRETIVFASLVSHGKGTGNEMARNFSNEPGSHKTSLGFYKTAETYHGKHGISLRLDGLEPANDNARQRAIVIHAADYVSEAFIRQHGRLGRSHGCPALPLKNYDQALSYLKGGRCLFIWADKRSYLRQSPWLTK